MTTIPMLEKELKQANKDLYYYKNYSERLNTDKEQLTSLVNSCQEEIRKLQTQLQQKENIIKEVREKVNNFDVFKEFTFPLMKRWEEEQVKSSIDYEWRKSIKQPILEILDKGE